MEYRDFEQKRERKTERVVLVIYSLYNLCMLYSTVRRGWPSWISILMFAAMILAWGIYLGRTRDMHFRAVMTTLLMQVSMLLYATHVKSIYPILAIFLAYTIFSSLYDCVDVVYLSMASAAFLFFYHIMVRGTLEFGDADDNVALVLQVANVFVIGYVLYDWTRKRDESRARYQQMIAELTDAEQSKDDFLANISHEIRTPINTITGMSEMALKEGDPAKVRDDIFNIQAAGRSLMMVVSDILDFSELQSGDVQLEEEEYGITSMLNDIMNMAMARKNDKDIELILDCDPTIPSRLLGDEKKIRRVILNIVDNAIKFTSEGYASIQVGYRRESYGLNLLITVKDSGIGIKDSDLENLFSSFNQVDAKRNRQAGGIGLGLAISQAIVQKMEGVITVKSQYGKGTMVRIAVPQKVLDESPIVQIADREHLNVAVYIDMEQFQMSETRDEYMREIRGMAEKLQIPCHVCRNLSELRRRIATQNYTYVFISRAEYRMDPAYFDEVATRTRLVVALDRKDDGEIKNPSILRIYKPFFLLSVASVLNGQKGERSEAEYGHSGKFVAPDAHVLVVDDNAMNLKVIEGLLEEYQIRVTTATSGREALEKIETMDYDFVFMDHMMPEMDGIETLHHLRQKAGTYYRRVPVLALTANAIAGMREKFLEEGFADFLEKPIEASVLERVLRRNIPLEKQIAISDDQAEDAGQEDWGESWDSYQDLGQDYGQSLGDLPRDGGSGGFWEAAAESEAYSPGSAGVGGSLGESSALAGGGLQGSGAVESGAPKPADGALADGASAPEPAATKPADGASAASASAPEPAASSKPEGGKPASGFSIGDLDVETGMLYCGGRQSYLKILKRYVESGNDMLEQARDLYAKEDWDNYVITVHGIKSSMLSIGAKPLSEMAKALELAGKGGDIGFIRENHEAMTAEFERVMKELEDDPKVNPRQEREKEPALELPELPDDLFAQKSSELEDAMYDLDGDAMLSIIEELEKYQCNGVSMEKRLSAVRRKVEMSDYMSAVDTLEKVRDKIAEEKGGAGA